MKICFLGLGSIGARHLRNFSELLESHGMDHTTDALRSSRRPLPEDVQRLVDRQYYDVLDMPDDYDIAFICTPTAMHYEDIKKMSKRTRHMFIEKPVFDRDYALDTLHLCEEGRYYVACPLRYSAVLQYLKNYIAETKVFAVRAICSTYLPDWRPNVDYRTIYSAHRDMGGGVSIDLIHEWDYLCWLFGMPENVRSAVGKYSELELDSDDLALYIGEYKDKLVSLHLDYFGRCERREIELYTKDETVIGDIRNGCVRFMHEGRVIDLSETRDAYQKRELEHFLDIIEGKTANDGSIGHALNVLKIAKGEWQR